MVPRQRRSVKVIFNTTGNTSQVNGEGGSPSPLLKSKTSSDFTRTITRRLITLFVIGVPVLLLVLFMLYPLAAIILQSVFPELYAPTPSLALDLSPLASVFSNPHNYLALFNSFWLGLVTSIIAGLIGTLLAILMTRTDLPAKKVVDICVWIIFFTPSFMLGEAWSVVFLRGGTLDHYVNLPDGFINAFFSPLGVILILSLKNFPLVYISVVPALRWLGSEFEDAARVAGARLWFAWWRINLPLLLPPILAGTFLVFADAISDFGVSATIAHNANVPLIPYQIYANVDTFPVNFPLAAAFSFLLFFAIVAAMLIQARIMRSRSFQVISGRTRPARPIQLGVWKIAAVIFTLVIIFLGFVIPFVTSVLMSLLHAYNLGFTADNWTLDNYTKALTIGSDSFASLVRTFWLALAAATIATLIGFIVAFVVNRTNLTGHRFLGFFTLITLGVPGLILAVGYIFAWNAPYLKYIGIGGKGFRIYGTLWILLAAYVGGHLPRTTQLSAGALEQVGQNILDSARVQGAGIFNLLRSVVAPIMRGNLASTWLLMFTSTMFELAASQLLYPPGQPTLPVEVIALFNTFQVGPGMALSLLCVFIVTILLVLLKVLPSLINGLVTWRLKEEKSAYVLASKELE